MPQVQDTLEALAGYVDIPESPFMMDGPSPVDLESTTTSVRQRMVQDSHSVEKRYQELLEVRLQYGGL